MSKHYNFANILLGKKYILQKKITKGVAVARAQARPMHLAAHAGSRCCATAVLLAVLAVAGLATADIITTSQWARPVSILIFPQKFPKNSIFSEKNSIFSDRWAPLILSKLQKKEKCYKFNKTKFSHQNNMSNNPK